MNIRVLMTHTRYVSRMQLVWRINIASFYGMSPRQFSFLNDMNHELWILLIRCERVSFSMLPHIRFS